ncbi:MAG TPA: PASTA domain-containing protein [Solirubrobacteraceae bacterium]|nr:PASTA domain-containing protein [Solirubrobacteraceae bacterium]
MTAPNDMATVREETVQVEGTVAPASADVIVLGQKAPVSGGGSFSATVSLEPGANVIDVMATAPGRGPALTAFRVTREVPVNVPDLDGMNQQEVEDALNDAGLTPEVEKVGAGIIDELLPGDPHVCEQDPSPGAQVRRGSKVHVVVSKSC